MPVKKEEERGWWYWVYEGFCATLAGVIIGIVLGVYYFYPALHSCN